jgi:hypothetical protein
MTAQVARRAAWAAQAAQAASVRVERRVSKEHNGPKAVVLRQQARQEISVTFISI